MGAQGPEAHLHTGPGGIMSLGPYFNQTSWVVTISAVWKVVVLDAGTQLAQQRQVCPSNSSCASQLLGLISQQARVGREPQES